MSVLRTFQKDPQATLDYTIDFSLWLNGDTISAATWTVGAGITKELDTKTATTVVIWLSGGTLATSYSVSVHIITVAGRIDDRTLTISVVDK